MRTTIILLLVIITFSSCYHAYYGPNTPNAPLLTEKGEVRLNTMYTYGGDTDIEGGELQFAYAFRDKWGFIFSGISAGVEENTGDYVEKGNGIYAEAGVGHFKRIDRNWMFECYGGLGTGSANNDYGLGDRSKVAFNKLFIQPAIALKTKHFEFAFITRFNAVNWKVKEERIKSSDNEEAKNDMMRIRNKSTFFAFEPGLIFRAGGENFKVQTGFTLSHPT